MDKATVTAYPASLKSPLEGLAAWRRRLARRAALGAALALSAVGLAALGWLDLLADLPGMARLVGLLLLLVGAVAAGIAVAAAWRRGSRPARLAAAYDRHGRTGGQVLAGLELAEAVSSLADPVSRSLAWEAAVAAGLRAAALRPRDVQPPDPARRPWAVAAGSAAALLLVALAWPAVFLHQALRLLDPLGDLPPYAPYRFDLEPGDARVFFGDPFSIRARARGERLPDRVEWVVERADGSVTVHPLIDQGNAAYAGTLGAVDGPFSYYVRGAEGRSARHRVAIVYTPRIDRVEARVAPPAYTRKAPYQGPYPEGGLLGVKGTAVTLTTVSNRPLRGGLLTWKAPAGSPKDAPRLPSGQAAEAPETPLVFQPGPTAAGEGGRVEGTFAIARDADFEITVTDTDGNACREPFRGRVVVLPDRPPTVALLEPPPESIATPDASVPAVVEAEDDFGLSRAALVRSLNGSKDHAKALDIPAEPSTLARALCPLPLASWDLQPGDVIELYATAADNDPAGAKVGQSKVHRVWIVSEEDFLRLARARQQIEDLMERYKPVAEALDRARDAARELREALERAEKTAPGDLKEKEAARRVQEAIDRLNEAVAEAARRARELAESPPLFDIDKALKQDMEKLARELADLGREAQEGMKGMREGLAGGALPRPALPGVKKALEGLERKLGVERESFEKEVEVPLDVLEKVYRLLEDEARFTSLALAQEDLARRARRFGDREKVEDTEGAQEMAGLAEEQRAMEEELRDLLQSIRDHAARLPKGEPFDKLRGEAEAFATAVAEAKAPEALEKAGGSLGGRAGKRAAKDAKDAADLLMSFVKQCRGGMGQQAGRCLTFQPKLQSGLGNTVEELLAGLGLPVPGGGVGDGTGMGMAGRGGASARSHTANNVGLYGPLPARGGGLSGKPGGTRGAGAPSRPGGDVAPGAGAEARIDLIYGGAPIEAVPGEYRAAVREYFRRVAEESGREGR